MEDKKNNLLWYLVLIAIILFIAYKVYDTMDNENILIVCNRGTLDNKAYMNEFEFKQALTDLNTNEIELRDNYDAVFHLVTSASGAEEYFLILNIARTFSCVLVSFHWKFLIFLSY